MVFPISFCINAFSMCLCGKKCISHNKILTLQITYFSIFVQTLHMIKRYLPFLLPAILLLLSFKPGDKTTNNPPVNVQADSIAFAIIGDYGRDTPQEDSVAKMVKSWNPDFIITVGDNNYPLGSASTINAHIGKYYCDYIYNPDAPVSQQCNGKATREKFNRFFPSPGNHDNYTKGAKPYRNYFTLPGDENNYEFTWGPVHFYSINSGTEGNTAPQVKDWLKNSLASNKLPFKLVYFHHPPFSSGSHGSAPNMQWPFHDWGVDAVLAGHEHFYAKVIDNKEKTPVYLICGSSGTDEHYDCNKHPIDPSRFAWQCDNVHFGAIKVRATAHKVIFEYYTIEAPSAPSDTYIIDK